MHTANRQPVEHELAGCDITIRMHAKRRATRVFNGQIICRRSVIVDVITLEQYGSQYRNLLGCRGALGVADNSFHGHTKIAH